MTNVALTGLARDLARRADEGRPVRIGVIGSGEMGTDLVTQGMLMRGIEVARHLDPPPAHRARGDRASPMATRPWRARPTRRRKVTAAIEARQDRHHLERDCWSPTR